MEIYIVKPGDSLYTIAALYKVTEYSLAFANQIPPPYHLVVGQSLLIPGANPPQIVKMINVNGFAYPFISKHVLSATLPYLTELSIFSYGFTPDGDIIPPPIDDSFMITMAKESKTAPILTLTPLGPDGTFNENLVTEVVSNEDVKANLIRQLVDTVVEKGFQGVNIDFENINARDKFAYAGFVYDVKSAVNKIGFPVSVDLASKTSDEDPNPISIGMDYKLLGEAANNVLLMTYEWGYAFGPPMAIAPLNKVREVVDYAVSKIPYWKINLGIPNYGYDWPIPFVSGKTKAKTINNIEAIQLAIANKAMIQYDEAAQSPYFRYWKNNQEHEVWFEDARSLKAKFDLITEYDLLGAGYWQIMNLYRANWQLLSDTFWVKKSILD